MAVGFAARALALAARKCSGIFYRTSEILEGFAIELLHDEEAFRAAFAEELLAKAVPDLVPSVCTHNHVCTVEGSCNGYPRQPVVDETLPEHVKTGLRKQHEAHQRLRAETHGRGDS